MYKFLLLLICFPFYTFGQASNPNLTNANLVIITTEDTPQNALDKFVNLLLDQNFYIQHIDKEHNILQAYKLVESSTAIKFMIQAFVTNKDITSIRLIGHYVLSGENGPYYYEARNSKKIFRDLETEAYTHLRILGLAYPNGVLSYLISPDKN